MPDIFENFYKDFGYQTKDFYDLNRLDPSYQVIFDEEASKNTCQNGANIKLQKFLKDASYKYEVCMGTFVTKPSLSILELINWQSMKASTQLFSSFSRCNA